MDENEKKQWLDKITNDGAARFAHQKQEMEMAKQAQINQILMNTQAKKNEIADSANLKRIELANEGEKIKAQILNEHEARRKVLEKEHQERIKEEKNRTELLQKDQESTTNEIARITARNFEEKIKETGETEKLRGSLAYEQNELSSEIAKEFHETEKISLKTHSELEKAVQEKEEENYQKNQAKTMEIYQKTISAQQQLLLVKLEQSRSDNLKEVDTIITNSKKLATIVQEYAHGVSVVLNENLDENSKKSAISRLDMVNTQLSALVEELSGMERKSTKISNLEIQRTLIDQILRIKKKITKVKGTIVEVKRDLRLSSTGIDVRNRQAFDRQIASIINQVNSIHQLDTGDEATRRRIAGIALEGTSQQPLLSIENDNTN